MGSAQAWKELASAALNYADVLADDERTKQQVFIAETILRGAARNYGDARDDEDNE